MAEVLVLSIVAILVILLVVRPLVSRAFESIPSAAAAGERLLADQAAAAAAALTAPGAPGLPSEAEGEDEQFEELIDIDRVEGRVRASAVKKVGEIVDKHPEEALSIVRSWMYQEG
jgi:flagellar M-ring protein FliF